MGAVAMALASTLRHGTNSAGRTVQSGLVTEEMETVRQDARTNFTTLPLGLVERDTDVDGVLYHVVRESEFVAESSSEDSCSNTSSGSGAAPAFLRVRVIVTWPGTGAAAPANAETLLAPPIGAYDPNKGHVAVQVRGRDATGVSGIPVALKRGAVTVRTLTTTTDGCAYFAFVDPGTYTVQLNRSGYVDGQMSASPTYTVTVAAAQAVSTDFRLRPPGGDRRHPCGPDRQVQPDARSRGGDRRAHLAHSQRPQVIPVHRWRRAPNDRGLPVQRGIPSVGRSA